MRLPSSSIVRILKSMPMVVMKEGVQASSQKRSRRHDFPTPAQIRQVNTKACSAAVVLFTRIAYEKELDKRVNGHDEGNGEAAKHTLIRKS